MTILFDMRNLTPVEREVWYDALINRVFHYDQKINKMCIRDRPPSAHRAASCGASDPAAPAY